MKKRDKGSSDVGTIIGDEVSSAVDEAVPKKTKSRIIIGVFVALAAAVALLVVTQCVAPAVRHNEGKTVTESELTQAIAVDQLNTAEMTYEGIVNHAGGFAGIGDYHVAYKATITAGINMDDVQVAVDADQKTVTITLPAVSIYDPVIDTGPLDYMPDNPGVDMQEIIASCKEDAAEATLSNTQIQQTAIQNAKSAIRALTNPLLRDTEYQIVWSDEADSGSSAPDQAGDAGQDNQDAGAADEGAGNESN